MNIKSNSKQPSTLVGFWKDLKRKLSRNKNMNYHLFTVGMLVGAYYAWSYSGILTLWLVVIGIWINVLKDNYDARTEQVITVVLTTFALLILSSTNVYSIDNKEIDVNYSKLEFTDSTERMVVHMIVPHKRVEVISNWSSSDYYTAKTNKDSVKIKIIEVGEHDHLSKVFENRKVEEYTYRLVVTFDGGSYKDISWSKTDTPKFPDVARHKVKD